MITQQIETDLKTAMRAKDQLSLRVLRALKNEFTNSALRSGSIENEIDDLTALTAIRKQIAQREDSKEQFIKGGRFDLAANEHDEIVILKKYLPVEMEDSVLEDLIKVVIEEVNATSKKDMGKVIKVVIERVNGTASNQRVSKIVSEYLK